MREASVGNRNALKHGYSGTPIGNAYFHMMRRCYNPKFKQFKDYGGRGITVCERWRDVRNFAADMGEPPAGYWLDRIDNNGNYEPGNCRWATPKEQLRNTSRNRIVECGNFRATVGEWAEELGINYEMLYKRIFYRHWPPDLAFTLPSNRGTQIKTLIKALVLTLCLVGTANAADRTLSWVDNSLNEEGFRLERNVDAGAFQQLGSDLGKNTTTTIDATTVVEGSTLCYRLKAFNTVGESAYSNTACMTVQFTIPAAPSNAVVK